MGRDERTESDPHRVCPWGGRGGDDEARGQGAPLWSLCMSITKSIFVTQVNRLKMGLGDLIIVSSVWPLYAQAHSLASHHVRRSVQRRSATWKTSCEASSRPKSMHTGIRTISLPPARDIEPPPPHGASLRGALALAIAFRRPAAMIPAIRSMSCQRTVLNCQRRACIRNYRLKI
jgi:hypothetical protein